MLKYRLIFGPCMIAALLALFYLDDRLGRIELPAAILGRTDLPPGLLLLAAFLALAVLVARELAQIFRAKHAPADTFMIWLSAAVPCLLIYLLPAGAGTGAQAAVPIYATSLAAMFLLALVRHSWRGRTEGAVLAAAGVLFALVYLGVLPGFYLAIRQGHSAWLIAAIVGVTKSCDIGAYFVGRAVGRHKLIPWLSPGKTWEGLAGGLAFSGALAVGLAAAGNQLGLTGVWTHAAGEAVFVQTDCPLWFAAVSGVLLGLVGQFGDLTASLFKRDAGLKDSGHSIPGFGGLLDVIDSPLVVAPVAYWLVQAGRHWVIS